MLTLAWQTVKARTSGFIGAFVAVLCGTALVAACGILMESGLRGGVPTQRYAATDVVVSGDRIVRPPGGDVLAFEHASEQPPVSAELVAKVRAVPGVRDAVAEQTFPATVVGPDGQVLADKPSFGHNWGSAVLAPFRLVEGRAPAAGDEVVLDAGLAAAVGDEVRIATRSVPVTYRVVGVAAGVGSRQASVFFSDAKADELAGRPGKVSAIGVLGGTPGQADAAGAGDLADRVEEALAGDHVSVSSGADRSAAEFDDVSQTKSILALIAGSFGGYAVLVAIFVVASTLALTVEQRRREFALLRAVGATPRQVRKLIGVETLVVAAVAGVLGSLLGIAVSQGLRSAFAGIGVVPADFELTISPIPLAAALLIGLGAARVAAWSASRRPSSINPVEALGEASLQKRDVGRVRLVIGWVTLAIGVGATAVPLFLRGQLGAAMSVMAALVIIIGLALVGPRVVGRMIEVVAPGLGRLSRVSGHLAAANAVKNSRRMAAAVTPLMLAIGFAVVNFYSQTTFTAAVQQETTSSITADHVITGVAGVPAELTAAVRGVPGVDGVTPLVRTQVITARETGDSVEVQRGPAHGIDGDAAVDLGVTSGSVKDLTTGTVALSDSYAFWNNKKVGDTAEFWYADGQPARLKVVATFKNDLAFGDHVMSAADARAHTNAGMDSAVLVRTNDVARLNDLIGRYPGLAVTSALAGPDRSDQRMQFLLNLVAVGVILGYVAISVSNTLVMSTAQRRREFALLRLVGTGRRQVVRMMRAEALLTVGIAVVLGIAVSALPLGLLAIGLTGTPLPSGPGWVFLAVLAGAALLGTASIALATRMSLRTKPIETIGMRE
ncbi:ABC transporter permease [Lentzea guizhouensis]|uniref:ABC transporter permease n=1 Tax=Lentzea guizhouensis TaxID=1586287 RepID=A0A1B2HTD3_9PSEU|nr:ABC transporter permease [Lentzea guizhouensis]ANZ40981.1 ABC transporter permease [Lentzea guizhouensis]